ncbi:MAG: hypothetical protein IT204_10820 [Fimbriimonadaceae bacterium]|nr:hypothetical protein [Fimbriimonadaceae bacterium]
MRRIAVHSTHEAADKLGGIGTVLQGILPEPAYGAAYQRTLLVGVYPFPTEGSVIDDEALRAARGWSVKFDSQLPRRGGALAQRLLQVAERYGVRLVYGTRRFGKELEIPTLVASPQGVRRALVDSYRRRLRALLAVDLEVFDDFPAVTDRVDRRLERLLLPGHETADVPERLIVDAHGEPFPGGVAWSDGRAIFPPLAALDAFSGDGRANKYLLELQYHTFAAPALWEATCAVLAEWAPGAGGYDPEAVDLYAHDWLGVPLWWASRVAENRVRRTVYIAHEARIFRLLAEGALHDRAALLRAVCHPEGYDAALYPHLAKALERGWDLATMYPGTVGFPDIFHHTINREAAHFDRVIAVGPLVRDELEVSLRPQPAPAVSCCPNGIPSAAVTVDQAWAARQRLAAVVEQAVGFVPDVIFSGVMRCELSKAPWRNIGLLRRCAERFPHLKAALLWLSAPKPRPTAAQVQRWSRSWNWPLDHRGGAGGDLRPEEEGLWRAADLLNRDHPGQAALLYINQFGWGREVLGALDPRDATFGDLRTGSDVELGLSIYEPFGIAVLEPFCAGTVCVVSDACGCARHLASLGLLDLVVEAPFTRHDLPPREVDSAALREIETDAYDAVLDAVVARLGLAGGPVDAARWQQLRAARLEAAQAVIGQLSWGQAVEQYLLPAVG